LSASTVYLTFAAVLQTPKSALIVVA